MGTSAFGKVLCLLRSFMVGVIRSTKTDWTTPARTRNEVNVGEQGRRFVV